MTAPHAGSVNDWLSSFEVGERAYVDVKPKQEVGEVMRRLNTAPSRRPESMRNMMFECSAWTAVGTKVGETRILVCVERVE